MGDFILHFCIRQYLRGPTERYHTTDWSKGAMLVKRAGVARTDRYDRWYGLLVDEMNLVATPGAGMFAVGGVQGENHVLKILREDVDDVDSLSGCRCFIWIEERNERREGRKRLTTSSSDHDPGGHVIGEVLSACRSSNCSGADTRAWRS